MNPEREVSEPSRRPANSPVARPLRPLLGVAFLYIAGNIVGLILPISHLWSGAAAFAAVILTLSIQSRPRATATLLLAAVFFTACFRCGLALDPPGRRSLPLRMDRDVEAITVVGRVADDPYFVAEAEDSALGTWRFRFALEGVNRVGKLDPIAGSANGRWHDAPGDFDLSYGDRLEVNGVVRRTAIFGSGAASLISVAGTGNDIRRLEQDAGYRLVQICYEARNYFAGVLSRGLGEFPDHVAILHALLLGYSGGMPDELQESFSLTGTLHIFAISGLHVGVVAGIICALLRICMVPRHRWIFVLAPLLILYAFATGMRPSAVRACVMALTFWSAGLVSRKPDAPTALAISAVLILAADPLQIASMGFILSFSVVTGILLLFPLFYQPGIEVLPDDPYAPRKNSRIRDLARAFVRWVWGLAAISLACWLVSFPLTAHFFNVFSPVALVGNLAVVPLTFVVVVTGFLSMVTGMLNGWVSEVFNHANVIFVEILLRIVDAMANMPAGHLFVRSPPWIWIAGYYLLLLGIVAIQDRRRWIAATLVLVLFAGWLRAGAVRTGEGVGVMNRSGSLSVNLEHGRGLSMLFDPGSRKRGYEFLSYLRKRGVNRIEVIVLSKVISSRAGIVPELLERSRVGEVMIARLDGDPDLLEELLTVARARNVRVSQLLRGGGDPLTSSDAWEVLSPGVEDDVLEVPCVIRIPCGESALLVVADLSPGGAYRFQRMYPGLRAAVVVEGASSVRGLRTDFFLESIDPALLVSPERFVSRPATAAARPPGIEILEIIAGELAWLAPASGEPSGYSVRDSAVGGTQ